MESPNFTILETKIKQALDHLQVLINENEDLRGKLSEINEGVDSLEPEYQKGQREKIRAKVAEMLTMLDDF